MRASSSSTSTSTSFAPTHRATAGSSTAIVSPTIRRVFGGRRASSFAGGTRRRRVELNDAPPPGVMMMSSRRRLVTTTAWIGGGLRRGWDRHVGGTTGRATRAWTVRATGDATEVRALFQRMVFFFFFACISSSTCDDEETDGIHMNERTNADDVQLLRYLPY